MNTKWLTRFVKSAGALLVLTALAKFVSAFGDEKVLMVQDPILKIPFRHVFLFVGLLESIVALICFFGQRIGFQIKAVAWLATLFVLYRIGLVMVDYHGPCSCLGNLTDMIHLPFKQSVILITSILIYLVVGSYVSLFWLWRQGSRPGTLPDLTRDAIPEDRVKNG